jgi:hypothetical protein
LCWKSPNIQAPPTKKNTAASAADLKFLHP